MKKRFNPLFPETKQGREPVISNANFDPIPVTATALSPVSNKPMRKVMCGGIEAYYDPENRLVLPMKA